jgi:hypothetical protein
VTVDKKELTHPALLTEVVKSHVRVNRVQAMAGPHLSDTRGDAVEQCPHAFDRFPASASCPNGVVQRVQRVTLTNVSHEVKLWNEVCPQLLRRV